ncbi:MAG: matrixin family metalloprotease [Salinigranum sp.]
MTRSRFVVVALALLLVLAGCQSLPVGPGSPTGTASPGRGAASPETASPSPTRSSATAAGTAGSPPGATARSRHNPWGSDPVVVAIADPAEPSRRFAPLVRRATAYWERHGRQYLGFDTSFVVRPDAENPDIVVRFVRHVPRCGVVDAAGCAPLINDSRQIDRPEPIWIRGGLSNDSTVLVVEHELGHALGLTHADAPADVMAAKAVLYTRPKPNATERDFPWRDANFTVYVDASNASDPAGARRQIGHALAYYEAGAPGMPSNVSFRRVDSPAAADIVVRFDDASCGSDPGSCVSTLGTDPDGDGAIERYTKLRITLVNLDTAAVGWHVGNWLAFALGAESPAERPPPFRNATYEERRSHWWK